VALRGAEGRGHGAAGEADSEAEVRTMETAKAGALRGSGVDGRRQHRVIA